MLLPPIPESTELSQFAPLRPPYPPPHLPLVLPHGDAFDFVRHMDTVVAISRFRPVYCLSTWTDLLALLACCMRKPRRPAMLVSANCMSPGKTASANPKLVICSRRPSLRPPPRNAFFKQVKKLTLPRTDLTSLA